MPSTLSRFRHQVTSAAQAFSRSRGTEHEPQTPTASKVRLLNDVAAAERVSELSDGCDWLVDGFDNLDRLIQDYIAAVPLAKQDGKADAEQFLEWLATHRELSEEQRDAIICQQSRYTVEFLAMKKRLSNARFQELLSNNSRLLRELSHNRTIRIHLNPAHVWASLETREFLDESTRIPARVLFYLAKDKVCGAVIGEELQLLFRKLQRGPRSLSDLRWVMPRHGDWDLMDVLRELAQLGIIALA
ncbi:MAG: hypothetical protein KDA90_10820 [Planctomycetaceae bacterium]|nr:hypothetical protein [Planctomycetaceae bacterium]